MLETVEQMTEPQVMWRIPNISEALEKSRKNDNFLLEGPEFNSHQYGYRLKMSLCPNGAGSGEF